jgi:cytoskeletal protein RodZ
VEDRPPIGAILREARLRQNLEIAACAEATRIRERYLVAIEDGRFESLPDPAYVNGFVRAYADHLGVVIDEPVRALPRDHELPPPGGRAQRQVRVRATRASGPRGGRRRAWASPKVLVPVLVVAVVIALSALGFDLPFV